MIRIRRTGTTVVPVESVSRLCHKNQRRACRTALIAESTLRYKSRRGPRTTLRQRISEIAQIRVSYRYRKIPVLPKREGWNAGTWLVYRHG